MNSRKNLDTMTHSGRSDEAKEVDVPATTAGKS